MLTASRWTSITHSQNPPYRELLQEWVTAYLNNGAPLRVLCKVFTNSVIPTTTTDLVWGLR